VGKPNLWGFRKVASKSYPIAGAAVSAAPGQVVFDLKGFLQTETISRLIVRVRGSLVIAGAGAGAATGRDNPESLVTNITWRHNPALGVVSKKRAHSARDHPTGHF
jgi:hypothetical protein